MNYADVLKGLNIEYEALLTVLKKTKPAVPLLSKNQTPLKRIESFKDFLFCTYCLRHCLLLYII